MTIYIALAVDRLTCDATVIESAPMMVLRIEHEKTDRQFMIGDGCNVEKGLLWVVKGMRELSDIVYRLI